MRVSRTVPIVVSVAHRESHAKRAAGFEILVDPRHGERRICTEIDAHDLVLVAHNDGLDTSPAPTSITVTWRRSANVLRRPDDCLRCFAWCMRIDLGLKLVERADECNLKIPLPDILWSSTATCKELLEPRSASLKASLLRTLYRKDQALPDRAPAARSSVASRMVPHAQCASGPIPDSLT